MIFSNAGRERLFEIDARWPTKIAFRMLLNLTCLLSIACALFTLTDNSDSSVIPFSTARAVLIYAPCDGVTIVWNMLNIFYFFGKKKVFSNVINLMVHFLLGTVFAVVGIYASIATWTAVRQLSTDPYSLSRRSIIQGILGAESTLKKRDDASCPGYLSCDAKAAQLEQENLRAVISGVGSVLFDVAFLLHVAIFLWCWNDIIYGLRGFSERDIDNKAKNRRTLEEKYLLSSGTTTRNRSFELDSYPSVHPLRTSNRISYSAHPSMYQIPMHPLRRSKSATHLRPSFRRNDSRPRTSAIGLMHHVSFDGTNPPYPVYMPYRFDSQPGLERSAQEREELPIFDNPLHPKPIFSRPLSTGRPSTAPHPGRANPRASYQSLKPIQKRESSISIPFDFEQEPNNRFSYQGDVPPTSVFKDRLDLPEGPYTTKEIRHLSVEDLNTTTIYQTDPLPPKRIFKRYSDFASRNHQADIEAGNITGL